LENKNINQQENQEQVGGKPKDRVEKELSDVSEFLKKIVMSNIDEQLRKEALELLEKVSDIKSYLDWANGKLRFYAKQRSQNVGGVKKWQSKR
jgi:hypothetical protein